MHASCNARTTSLCVCVGGGGAHQGASPPTPNPRFGKVPGGCAGGAAVADWETKPGIGRLSRPRQKQCFPWRHPRAPAHTARAKYAATTRFCLDPRGMAPPGRSANQGRVSARLVGRALGTFAGQTGKPGSGPKNQGDHDGLFLALNCRSLGTTHIHRTKTKKHGHSVFGSIPMAKTMFFCESGPCGRHFLLLKTKAE